MFLLRFSSSRQDALEKARGGGGGGGGGGGRVGAINLYKNFRAVNLAETSTVSMQICLLRWAI